MSTYNRIHLVVLDSVGIGAAPDANDFVNAAVPDGASDTLGHISKTVGLEVPNMAKLGLGNIPREVPLKTVPAEANPTGYATKLEEVSLGKDTMTGHWEIMGLNITEPFDTFWDGFPEEILTKIEEFSGRKIIREANKPYSGTAVIDDFGPRQMETGELIVYTSADPVLQIAAHEEVIPLEELYRTATFYSQFSFVPKGEYTISICMGTACYVKGAGDILDDLSDILKIKSGETTEDKKFTLESCRCIGACGLAPVLKVNEEVYGRLNKKKSEKVLATYQKEA